MSLQMLINFKLSPTASAELRRLRNRANGSEFVPTLYWSSGARVGGGQFSLTKGEAFCVGLYSSQRANSDRDGFVEIDGIGLVIEAWWHERLCGKTLDFVDGRFLLVGGSHPQE